MRNARGFALLLGLVCVQLASAGFFAVPIVLTLLGIQHKPLDWQIHEILEVGAALGLIFGAIMGGVALRKTMVRQKRAEEQLRQVSGAFMELMHSRFLDWGLTSAERDVAMFAVKGMNTSEIAELRGTADGTIKAQTNAIYRKAGVTGRPQLLSLFIEDLMDDSMLPKPSRSPAARGVPAGLLPALN
ncbi:MAG: helix-turn-helix transcriptional regulator [Rhodobacteraceae bacterium]|nr:helix-turn-helix transcriptional regulator [Paracoccaceae bacterium]